MLINTQRPSISMPSTRARCPKCDRCFRRLDTHLPVSATCRDVQGRRGCLPAPPSRSVSSTSHSNSTASCSNSSVTLHGNLNSTVTTTAVATTTVATTPQDRSTLPALHFNDSLRLPRSPEEWEEADHLLCSVTASVLQASTAEEKNSCLCAGIYDILAVRFGTRATPRPQIPARSNLKQHDRALKEVTRLKNEARRAFRSAKREGASTDAIQSLATNFLSLLRQHSRLSRESSLRLRQKEARVVRKECHRNFWKFAKNLLDKGSTAHIYPAFSACTAHSFFSEVYKSTPHQFHSPSSLPHAPPPTAPWI